MPRPVSSTERGILFLVETNVSASYTGHNNQVTITIDGRQFYPVELSIFIELAIRMQERARNVCRAHNIPIKIGDHFIDAALDELVRLKTLEQAKLIMT